MTAPTLNIATGKLASRPASWPLGSGHLLATGTTGAGKSSWINSIVGQAAERADVQLIGCDLKRVELGPWAERFSVLARTDRETEMLGRGLCGLLDRRIEIAERFGWRTWPTSPEHPAALVIVDELAEAMRLDAMAEAIDRIGRLGRFVALTMGVATQQASAKLLEGTGLRALFTRRAVLYDPEETSYAMQLGRDWKRQHGSLIAWLSMSRPGLAVWSDPAAADRPWLARAPYWADADVAAQVARTRHLNQPLDLLAGAS